MSPIQRPVASDERAAVRARLAAVVEEIRSQMPADTSEEEIERVAKQAIEGARRERRARRR